MKTDTPKQDQTTPASVRRMVRLLLLPFAFALEIALLGACSLCIGLSVFFPAALRWGDAIADLAMKTPDLKWYLPNHPRTPAPMKTCNHCGFEWTYNPTGCPKCGEPEGSIPNCSAKLRAFMEALEMNHIDYFIATADVEDFRKLGRTMTTRIHEKISSQNKEVGHPKD